MYFTLSLSALLHCQRFLSTSRYLAALDFPFFLWIGNNFRLWPFSSMVHRRHKQSFLASVFFILFAVCPLNNVPVKQSFTRNNNNKTITWLFFSFFSVFVGVGLRVKNIVSKKEILIDPESPVMSRCHEFPGRECPDSIIHVYRFHYEPISVPKKKILIQDSII